MTKLKILCLMALLLIPTSLIQAHPSSSTPHAVMSPTTTNSNIAFIGHIGGAISAVAVRGQYAFIGMGSEFAVLDVSQPDSPRRIAYLMLEGLISAKGIVLADDYAYVTANKLYVIDIHDPTQPVIAGAALLTDLNPGGLTLSGQYVYVASGGIRVFDIANPINPIQVGYYDDYGALSQTIVVSGRYAHYTSYQCYEWGCGSAKAYLVDVIDPTNPTYITTYLTLGSRRIDVAVEGTLAYVAGDNSLYAVDFSTPVSPTLIGSYVSPGTVTSIVIDNGVGYLGEEAGLHAINVMTPSQMIELDFLETRGAPYTVALTDYGYAATGNTLQVLNVEDPTDLKPVGAYTTLAFANSVSAQGDFVYATNLSDGLYIFDAIDPANPFLASATYTTTLSGKLAVKSNTVYVVTDGLAAVDVSNPSNPVFLDYQDSSMPISFGELVISDTYAYLGGDNLSVMDISNSANLAEVGVVTDTDYILGLAVAGDYVYKVRGGSSTLAIIDISNPTQPFIANIYSPGNFSWDVAVAGDYAYITDAWVGGLVDIVNVFNPTQPIHANYYLAYGKNITIVDEYAYLTTDVGQVLVLDLTAPTQPRPVGSYGTTAANNDIAVAKGNMYVACGDQGIYILRLLTPQAFLPLVTR